MKKTRIHYGKGIMELILPPSTAVLEGQDIPAIANCDRAIQEALYNPIGTASLEELLQIKKPSTVAITISDITRPVPNKIFMPHLLNILNKSGVKDSQIVIIIGTGMHRPSTPTELEYLLGIDILARIEVIDHTPGSPERLTKVCGNPSVSLCSRFANADFKIVTGLIEPHFMAGFSGGRKGVCPALVDLKTIELFHGYNTLANPKVENGLLKDNPCHEIALKIAKSIDLDFLFNVAITKNRKISGIYCGDLEKAHQAGCEEVAKWITVDVEKSYDLVITNGGGYPLDQTFYHAVKGMCTAIPALNKNSTLLIISHCGEQLGSNAYSDLMLKYQNDWRKFLEDISTKPEEIQLDQWQYQMHARVLELIGLENLRFVSDGITAEIQRKISVHPILGPGNAQQRAQQAIDKYVKNNPDAKIAVIPEGPYAMLRKIEK
ncbi:MAG: nickel-dependent lactate racemase [Sedimentisphaerales bacterium]|nr:nickel-dependent lactate racemase [Sedimentisphaerales bacterium]